MVSARILNNSLCLEARMGKGNGIRWEVMVMVVKKTLYEMGLGKRKEKTSMKETICNSWDKKTRGRAENEAVNSTRSSRTADGRKRKGARVRRDEKTRQQRKIYIPHRPSRKYGRGRYARYVTQWTLRRRPWGRMMVEVECI